MCCAWFGYDGLSVLLPGFGLLEVCVCFLCFERVSVVVWVEWFGLVIRFGGT